MYPALAVAAELRKRADADSSTSPLRGSAQNDNLLYVGRAESIEARLAERAHIPFRAIQVGGVRGVIPWTDARSLWRLFRSIIAARAIMRDFKPDAIFVTGGYVSAPVIWASAAEKIPSVIYLPDLEPGWAIRATARWATRVAISFPEVAKHFAAGKTVVTGYPVREAFFQTDQTRARHMFQLDPNAQTVTIFGGSRGALHINLAVTAHLTALARLAQIIHITGREDETWVRAKVESLPDDLRARVRVFGYLDDELPPALAAADVVIARAGAATLAEFPALGVPAILVPYPFAGKHQEMNARFLVARGAAMRVDDAGLKSELIPTLKKLFGDPGQLRTMSDASRALAQPDAAINIVELLEALEARA